MNKQRYFLTASVLLLLMTSGAQASSQGTGVTTTSDRVVSYQYETTRRLVDLVNDAAALTHKEGKKAFTRFSEPGSRWFHDGTYLFIYNTKGECVFEPVPPCEPGKSYLDLRDFDGKPMVKRMVDLISQGPGATDWFFYLWKDGMQFNPIWKSVYARSVVAPSGEHWVIGSGLYNLRVEREFLRRRVDLAATRLEQQGWETAFQEFRDPSSPFVFLGSYIFVLNMRGQMIVDPVSPGETGRSLMNFKDAMDKPVVKSILVKLQDTDAAWVQYKWPEPGTRVLGRKVVYVRKVETPQGTVIVGADAFLASPIWMRG